MTVYTSSVVGETAKARFSAVVRYDILRLLARGHWGTGGLDFGIGHWMLHENCWPQLERGQEAVCQGLLNFSSVLNYLSVYEVAMNGAFQNKCYRSPGRRPSTRWRGLCPKATSGMC